MIFAGFREERRNSLRELNLSRINEPRQMCARYLDNYKIIRYCSLTSFVSAANNDNTPWYREIFRKSHRRFSQLFYRCRLHVVTTRKKITRCSKFVALENFSRRLYPTLEEIVNFDESCVWMIRSCTIKVGRNVDDDDDAEKNSRKIRGIPGLG